MSVIEDDLQRNIYFYQSLQLFIKLFLIRALYFEIKTLIT